MRKTCCGAMVPKPSSSSASNPTSMTSATSKQLPTSGPARWHALSGQCACSVHATQPVVGSHAGVSPSHIAGVHATHPRISSQYGVASESSAHAASGSAAAAQPWQVPSTHTRPASHCCVVSQSDAPVVVPVVVAAVVSSSDDEPDKVVSSTTSVVDVPTVGSVGPVV